MTTNIRDQTIKAVRNVLKLFLPAWCLPNGKINATDAQLEGASSSCERWGIWCGALVIVSIFAEFAIAWIEPPYSLFLKVSLFPDAGVAIGIIGEVSFGIWNNRIQTELRSRSNKQLAEAIRQTEKMRAAAAWRTFTKEQLEAFAKQLKESPPTKARLAYVANDLESLYVAIQLGDALEAGGWTYGIEMRTQKELWFGIFVPEPGTPEVIALRKAFIQADILFFMGPPLPAPLSVLSRGKGTPPAIDAPVIFVGSKEPPKF